MDLGLAERRTNDFHSIGTVYDTRHFPVDSRFP